MNRIIQHSKTQKTKVSNFTAVNDYISHNFSNIDVSNIPIYLTSNDVMDAAGFIGIGGFYVHHMKLIVVKKEIVMGGDGAKTKFNKVLQKHMHAKVDIEDIIVHEMIHAVSGEANKSTRKYVFAEEEFVYTNSINFYKNKHMSEKDIVDKIFMPFCVQDIFHTRKELEGIITSFAEKYVAKIPDMDSQKAVNYFLGRHAEKIVPMIINRARELGFHMIDLYNKHGRGIQVVNSTDTDSALRFRSIDFDCDW